MDTQHFDALTRVLARMLVGRRLALAALAAGFAHLDPLAARKRKKRPLQFNAFGCVDVGGKCRGKDSACCSGICQGRKPKGGKADKRRCVAHNTGGCTAAEQSCGANPDIPCAVGGLCLATTGKAGFCGRVVEAACAACRKDEDCRSFGEGAACVVCANGSCPETGDRVCVPAAA